MKILSPLSRRKAGRGQPERPKLILLPTVRLSDHYRNCLARTNLLYWSLGIIFLWFGALKFFPEMSPAEELAGETIRSLSFGWLNPNISILLLATLETVIGAALLVNFYRNVIIIVAFIHIIFTFTPLLLFPEQVFNAAPFGLTLVGQYITKNLVILVVLINLMYVEKRPPNNSLLFRT
jgi:hypothetical protein